MLTKNKYKLIPTTTQTSLSNKLSRNAAKINEKHNFTTIETLWFNLNPTILLYKR